MKIICIKVNFQSLKKIFSIRGTFFFLGTCLVKILLILSTACILQPNRQKGRGKKKTPRDEIQGTWWRHEMKWILGAECLKPNYHSVPMGRDLGRYRCLYQHFQMICSCKKELCILLKTPPHSLLPSQVTHFWKHFGSYASATFFGPSGWNLFLHIF